MTIEKILETKLGTLQTVEILGICGEFNGELCTNEGIFLLKMSEAGFVTFEGSQVREIRGTHGIIVIEPIPAV